MSRAERPEIRAHQQWLGFVQPVGLVVSLPALEKAQAYVNRNIVREQEALIRLCEPEDAPSRLVDLAAFAREVLGWEPSDLAGAPGGPALPPSLEVPLPEYGEILRPSYAVPDPDRPGSFVLLVQLVAASAKLDRGPADAAGPGWHASPEARLERLLRETGVTIGLLCNGEQIRLVYAPRGESAGHLSFPVQAMCEVAGRPILAALHLLLSAERLFTLPEPQRLPAILRDSRRYQNEVSTALSEQVLAALHELLRGFQAANEAAGGRLLQDVLVETPEEVYGGLLTTLLRLVFVLYAEDRGLLPGDPVYVRHYAVTALFERLREDAARWQDTMDQRYGAWSRLLSLFRLIHDGGGHGRARLPPRYGRLFDPDAYPFLEGRRRGDVRVPGAPLEVPRVSDGVVYRVLTNLLLLKGDRLSYRALDVEQIGSVYEAMMGFALEVVAEPSIAVRPHHVVVGLSSLLKRPGADRLKALGEVGCKVGGKAQEAVRQARAPEELVAALGKLVSPRTPELLAPGTMVLQPTEERRRSGSHYTPRALTEPIVETTLRPLFEAMGPDPRPERILELKVCDPAMGSGAFLVAVCRALGDKLVAAWQRYGAPAIAPDEDPVLHARRMVAQRCLYGVDKNPFAVDLAKLSLWLVTLAKDHPFTFLDHALRQGDSLVGLSREQIASFHWAPERQVPILRKLVDDALKEAEGLRRRIQELADSDDVKLKQELLGDADEAVEKVRQVGALVLEAFFSEEKEKGRREKLKELGAEVAIRGVDNLPEARVGEALTPFHWEIEFPEVFSRENPGFDAFVGNPPFLGGLRISAANSLGYRDWLAERHQSSGLTDLVAHFFRRCHCLMRRGGCAGLLATNTISQGDTRAAGLRWICENEGIIYDAKRRLPWPGLAAVVVSVVHFAKVSVLGPRRLDGRVVEQITAFLFHSGGNDNPAMLKVNQGVSAVGSYVLGIGFVFEDGNDGATPLREMNRLVLLDSRNRERIFGYLGGEELNRDPSQRPTRFIVDFDEMSEVEARAWPDLMRIVESKVKPARQHVTQRDRRELWWLHATRSPEMRRYVAQHGRCLALSRVSTHLAPTFIASGIVVPETVVVILTHLDGGFAVVQSRVHEVWARFFSSSMKDDLRYSPTDCFETFPFPPDWQQNPRLEEAGKAYYEFRAALMADEAVRARLMDGLPPEGLTATYNRFHDPDERLPGILRLRELHDAMDRAVLDAYGWTDLHPACQFLLDYEDDEDDDADDRPRARARKKPWRYRWPDDLRDEVLARLLALNAERAAEERLLGAEASLKPARAPKPAEPAPPQGAAQPEAPKPKKPRGRPKKGTPEGQGSMFD